MITQVTNAAAPIGDCKSGKYILWLYPLQMSSTTLLFFVRVRAVYRDSKWIIVFFFLMWLVVSGTSITTICYTFTNLGPTKYCIGIINPGLEQAANILPLLNGIAALLNDTLVFLAITLRLVGTPEWSAVTGRKNRIRAAFSGDYLPAFSKAMLRDGQAYYLLVTIFCIPINFSS